MTSLQSDLGGQGSYSYDTRI